MKLLRAHGLTLVLLVAALVLLAGFVSDELRLGVQQRDLNLALSQKDTFSIDLQAARDEAAASQKQVDALATRAAGLDADLAAARDAPADWNSQTFAFKSEYDGASQSYLLLSPKAMPTGKRPLVVYFHSLGHGPDEVTTLRAGAESLVSFLMRRGVILASPSYRGDSWLNPAATADVSQVIHAVQARWPIGPVVLSGYSMGGTAALIYAILAPHDVTLGGLVAANYASDVAGLWTEGKNAQVKESIRTAYGGSPDQQPAVYDERSVLGNLIHLPAQMPIALYASYSDSMIPVAQQTRLRDALALRGNPMLYVVIPGDQRLESLDEGFAFVLNRLEAR